MTLETRKPQATLPQVRGLATYRWADLGPGRGTTMSGEQLAAALEAEHRRIDSGIEDFLARRATGARARESLGAALAALRRHIYLEEVILFPSLRGGSLDMALFVMEREHGRLWDLLDALDQRQGQWGGAEARQLCQRLLQTLEKHNAKEEPVIYPQADEGLEDAAARRLGEFLATGQMPEGWRCARASA